MVSPFCKKHGHDEVEVVPDGMSAIQRRPWREQRRASQGQPSPVNSAIMDEKSTFCEDSGARIFMTNEEPWFKSPP